MEGIQIYSYCWIVHRIDPLYGLGNAFGTARNGNPAGYGEGGVGLSKGQWPARVQGKMMNALSYLQNI